jgi:hypothetical protein
MSEITHAKSRLSTTQVSVQRTDANLGPPGYPRLRPPPFAKSAKGWATHQNTQSDFPRLAGGTIPFMRRYTTICP